MNNIKELRNAKKMSQIQLAKIVGVTQGAVYQWEKGLASPAFKNLRDIALALDVTVDELLRESDEQEAKHGQKKQKPARGSVGLGK